MNNIKESIKSVLESNDKKEVALAEEILNNEENAALYFEELKNSPWLTDYVIISVIEKVPVATIVKILFSRTKNFRIDKECVKHIISRDKTSEVLDELKNLETIATNIKILYETLDFSNESEIIELICDNNTLHLSSINNPFTMLFYILLVMYLKNKKCSINPYETDFKKYQNDVNVMFLYNTFEENDDNFIFENEEINLFSVYLFLLLKDKVTDSVNKLMFSCIYHNFGGEMYYVFKFLSEGFVGLRNINIYIFNSKLKKYDDITYNNPVKLSLMAWEEELMKIPSQYLYDETTRKKYDDIKEPPYVKNKQELIDLVVQESRISAPYATKMDETKKLFDLIANLVLENKAFRRELENTTGDFWTFAVDKITKKRISVAEVKDNKNIFFMSILKELLDTYFKNLIGFDFNNYKSTSIVELFVDVSYPLVVDLILNKTTEDNIINLSFYLISFPGYVREHLKQNDLKYNLINKIIKTK